MSTYEAVFKVKVGNVEQPLFIALDAKDEHDAAHKIEVALQRLMDSVESAEPAERPGQQWGVWFADTGRWLVDSQDSQDPWLGTREEASFAACSGNGVAKPYPERVEKQQSVAYERMIYDAQARAYERMIYDAQAREDERAKTAGREPRCIATMADVATCENDPHNAGLRVEPSRDELICVLGDVISALDALYASLPPSVQHTVLWGSNQAEHITNRVKVEAARALLRDQRTKAGRKP